MTDTQTANLGDKKYWLGITAFLYILIAGIAAWQTVQHTIAATGYFDQICDKENLQNEGAHFLLPSLNNQHRILGPFISPSIKQFLDLPTFRESSYELGTEIPRLAKLVKQEGTVAAWWSWLLLSVSLVYVVAAIATHGSFRTRNVLVALISIGTICFVVGIAAPAMMIFTVPSIPIESGSLTFVLQHQVRSIVSVIVTLFSAGHWIIAGLITLFSIVTPLIKTSLTVAAITTHSPSIKSRIAKFLHSISKWSMADVFVAGVLLACFALKSEEATKVIACRGLYYFVGYCLLSMTATSLLANTDIVENKSPEAGKKLGMTAIGGLFVTAFFVIAFAAVYTHQKHPATTPPIELCNSQVNLRAHHWRKLQLSISNPGTLTIELRVTKGNPVDVALIPADQLVDVEQPNGSIHPGNLLKASIPAFRAVGARAYCHISQIDKGEFEIVVEDTRLGILSALASDIEIHAYLAR